MATVDSGATGIALPTPSRKAVYVTAHWAIPATCRMINFRIPSTTQASPRNLHVQSPRRGHQRRASGISPLCGREERCLRTPPREMSRSITAPDGPSPYILKTEFLAVTAAPTTMKTLLEDGLVKRQDNNMNASDDGEKNGGASIIRFPGVSSDPPSRIRRRPAPSDLSKAFQHHRQQSNIQSVADLSCCSEATDDRPLFH